VSGTLYKTTLFETYSKDSLLNGVLSVHQHFIDQKIFIVPNDHNIVIRGRCPTFREDHTSRCSLYYFGIRIFDLCQNYNKELSHQSSKYKCLKCVFKCSGSYL